MSSRDEANPEMGYREELLKLSESDNLRALTTRGSVEINLASNDYLGIGSDSGLRDSFFEQYRFSEHSMSAASSRLLTGNYSEYELLEQDIAASYCGEAALIFNSGYHAGIGIIPALSGRGDLIVADKLVHASIIDGLKLSDATVWRYPHLQYDKLVLYLEKHRSKYSRLFIITESIFSMDGDVANLKELADIKDRFNGMLYVDEAHAFGAVGKMGLGVVEQQGVAHRVELIVGTFGKAFSSVGAYLICSKTVRDYLVNKMRSLIFTTGLPEINVAWSRFLLSKQEELLVKRERLADIVMELNGALGISNGTHIIPYIIGDNSEALRISKELVNDGILALPIRYPTVPQGSARLRLSLTASLKIEDITRIVSALERGSK